MSSFSLTSPLFSSLCTCKGKIMKSNTLFQDRFQNKSKRERCPNVGSLLPYFLTSFLIASIFSFFVLYSPDQLSIVPLERSQITENDNQNQQDHPQEQQDHVQRNSKSQKEEKTCDLSKGQWIRTHRKLYYTNSSCKLIPDSKNCFNHGREDKDFLNWKWKPKQCELQDFDPKAFLGIVRGKKMAFIGDSVARNHMDSLLCLLSQEETPNDIFKDSEDRYRKWHFPSYDFTLMALWSRFLVVGEERIINGTGSGIFELQLDKLDEDWTKPFPDIDFAIFSSGHWFFRIMHLHENNKQVGCVYCQQPNTTKYNSDFALQMAFRRAFNHINNCQNCKKTIAFLRTFAPAHFEGGFWDTGGYCNRTGPKSEGEVDFKSFEWQIRNVQMEEFERARNEGKEKGHRFGIVDVTRAMLMRPDGHPGEHWGNKWMKGYNDCTHWCMPGPVDAWSEIFLAVLKKELGLSSSGLQQFKPNS